MNCGDVGVSLLGPVEIRNGSARLELTRLELALVSALAITPGRPASVDRLADDRLVQGFTLPTGI